MKLKQAVAVLAVVLPTIGQAQWSRWEPANGGNGHWYKAIPNTTGITPRLAVELARQEGGYLATIASADENAFVFSLVNSPAFFSAFNGSGPALGGRQEASAPEPAGGWYWVTGLQWEYTNWYPGQPDNGGGVYESEESLSFFSGIPSTPAPTWNDQPLDDANCGGCVVERNDDPNRFWLSISVKTVEVTLHVTPSKKYQLQSSLDLKTWSNLGDPFVATTSEVVQEFNAIEVGRYFRLNEVP